MQLVQGIRADKVGSTYPHRCPTPRASPASPVSSRNAVSPSAKIARGRRSAITASRLGRHFRNASYSHGLPLSQLFFGRQRRQLVRLNCCRSYPIRLNVRSTRLPAGAHLTSGAPSRASCSPLASATIITPSEPDPSTREKSVPWLRQGH